MIGFEIKAAIIAELLKSEVGDVESMSKDDVEGLMGKLFDKVVEHFGLGL